VVAELLHLCLQRQGYAGTHKLVNKTIVPNAARTGQNLVQEMISHLELSHDRKLRHTWLQTPQSSMKLLVYPHRYIGDAIRLANAETRNVLE